MTLGFSSGRAAVSGEKNSPAGRFVIATQDLDLGTQVLFEEAYVQGPRQNSADLICIECCTLLDTDSVMKCELCDFPLCKSCAESGIRTYHNEECHIFVLNGVKFRSVDEGKKLFPCITVLRLGLNGIQDLETHHKERDATPVWIYNKKSVYPFLLSLRTKDGEPLFLEEDLDKLTGALDTNSFKIQEDKIESRAVFMTASMFNNSCVPNCQREVTRKGITIKTTRAVKKGEELTICYTGLLTPNHIRSAIFKQTKYFTCCCARCQDPTELQTYPDSVACPDCSGPVLNSSCVNCGEKIDSMRENQVRTLCDTLVNRLMKEQDCDMLKNGFMKLERMVWKFNYLLVKLKIHILQHKDSCESCQQSHEFSGIEKNIQDLRNCLGITTYQLHNEQVREHQEAASKMSKMMI